MQCPACGNETPEAAFCAMCGAQMGAPAAAPEPPPEAPPTQVPPPVPPAQQPAPAQPSYPPQSAYPDPAQFAQPAAPPPKKKRGCLKGCLWTFLVLTLVSFGVCALLVDLPQLLGIGESDAEQQLGSANDLLAAEEILVEFEAHGQPRAGIRVYVWGLDGEERSLAYVTLDERDGFEWASDDGGVPVREHLFWVADSDIAADIPIVRVAVEYIDAAGDSVLTITAPTDAIRDFASGSITEEAFFELADAQADADDMLTQYTGWFQ